MVPRASSGKIPQRRFRNSRRLCNSVAAFFADWVIMGNGTGGQSLRLSDLERLDRLRLIRSENVGPRTFYRLMKYCGGASAALAALPDLARRGGASGSARICSRR